jgi:hypothetical protein
MIATSNMEQQDFVPETILCPLLLIEVAFLPDIEQGL